MAWPQDAYVGQPIICINSSFTRYGGIPVSLTEGQIYHIREMDPTPDKRGGLAFYLQEANSIYYWHRFRPLQSTATGYSILAKLLQPKELEKFHKEEKKRELALMYGKGPR